MMKFRPRAISASFLAALAIAAAAADAAALDLGAGHAALLRLKHPARSVVIGNPAVADVSVEGPQQLTVFGKQPGGTSLIVLGEDNTVLLRTEVVVHPGTPSGVTVTYGAGKKVEPGGDTVVYACGKTCARTVETKQTAGATAGKPAAE